MPNISNDVQFEVSCTVNKSKYMKLTVNKSHSDFMDTYRYAINYASLVQKTILKQIVKACSWSLLRLLFIIDHSNILVIFIVECTHKDDMCKVHIRKACHYIVVN